LPWREILITPDKPVSRGGKAMRRYPDGLPAIQDGVVVAIDDRRAGPALEAARRSPRMNLYSLAWFRRLIKLCLSSFDLGPRRELR
jgi:hypothetical protein